MDTQKYCLISNLAAENRFVISRFFRNKPEAPEDSGWIFLSGEEDKSFLESESNFQVAKLSHVILNNPKIRDHMEASPGSEFIVEKKSGRIVNINKQATVTVASDTYASNPGQLAVNPFVWSRSKPKWPLLLGGAFLISVLPFAKGFGWLPLVRSLLLLIVNVVYWLRIYEHFKRGDSAPGKIISLDPPLVAVATDLSKGNGIFPVLKVTKHQKGLLRRIADDFGAEIPTVSLFKHSEKKESPHWDNVFPLPAQFATSSQVKIETAMNTFHPDEWKVLADGIRQLPKPYSPGLYRINEKSSSWKL